MISAFSPVRFGIRIADLKNENHYSYQDPKGRSHRFYVDFGTRPDETVDVSGDGKTAQIACFVGTRGGMNQFATITTGIGEGGHLEKVTQD